MRLAVIGNPIAHSRSPEIFAWIAERAGVDVQYSTQLLEPGELFTFLEDVRAGALDGCSVTLPFKREAALMVDKRASTALQTVAVNTIVRNGRSLVGHNTDVIGVQRALGVSDRHRKRVLILGAGGAARAALVALAQHKVTVANRSRERLELLNSIVECTTKTLDQVRSVTAYDIIINATSVGLTSDDVLLPEVTFSKKHTVMDMVYTPRVTPLLSRAAEQGAIIVDGLWMLAHQAFAQAERFGIIKRATTADALWLHHHLAGADRAVIDAGRRRINDIDEHISALLGERLKVAEAIGPRKAALGLPVVRPERERELRAMHDAWAIEHGLSVDYLRALFDVILDRSRNAQHQNLEQSES